MFKRIVYISLFILGLANTSTASHIVGGEIYYELVNSNQNLYRITMKVYVDCQWGRPEAIASDASANIGIYNAATNAFKSSFIISRTGPKRLNEVNYNCVIPPTNVCVDQYTYTTTKQIDPGTTGVILSWQRCCRNNTISNIIAPQDAGITLFTRIPPTTTKNNSAVFTKLPPNYVCLNAPLTVDHSAVDADGDSLIYSLNTPYNGADKNDPSPTPGLATRPPYSGVSWKTPYNILNQMAGSPRLKINSSTGELTVTPDTKGQFVIGITVREYRNGVYVGETRRDYQMNVIDCEFDILANFNTVGSSADADGFVFECQDTVFFIDKSLKAKDYYWNFGDPTTEADTSNLKNPWYIYPGNGDYVVTLRVVNDLCEDTYKFTVKIRSTQTFSLGPDLILCPQIYHLLNTKTPDATSIEWNTGQSGQRIYVLDTGTYIATVSYDKCVYYDTIHISSDPVPDFSIPEDTLFCDAVDMTLDVGVTGLSYAWSTSPSDRGQSVRVLSAGTVIVAVSTPNCTVFDTTRIWQATQPVVEDAFYCAQFEHQVDAGDHEEGQFLWSNGSMQQNTTYYAGGTHWIRVTQRHCVKTDSFHILNPSITFSLGDDAHYCDAFTRTLDAGTDGERYEWSTGESTQTITVDEGGTYKVKVIDPYGCTLEDSVVLGLTNSPIIDLGYDTTICVSSPATIGVPDIYSKYEWNTDERSPMIDVEFEGTYFLTVTDQYGCSGSDDIYVTVDPNALPNELFVPNAFTPDNNGLNETFPYSSEVVQPGYFIVIYSRWGELVFDSRLSESTNWDGYYKGEKVPNETFMYWMVYKACDGSRKQVTGTVNPIY